MNDRTANKRLKELSRIPDNQLTGADRQELDHIKAKFSNDARSMFLNKRRKINDNPTSLKRKFLPQSHGISALS